MKTLSEYITLYEKHTGEAFAFKQPFSFIIPLNMAFVNIYLKVIPSIFGKCAEI